MSREYTMPRSFCEKRPFVLESAYTVRKLKRARGWRYSGTWGAVLRNVETTSRRVASFLRIWQEGEGGREKRRGGKNEL